MTANDAHSVRRSAGKRSRLRMLEPVWSVTLIALVAVFVWRQRADLLQAVHETRLADWRWLALLVTSALLMHIFMTQTLSSVLLRLGRRVPFIPALMTHAERETVAAVMPLGGAASFITLVTRFGAYGVTRNDAMLAVMLYSMIGHLSFIAVAVPSLALLVARHNATGPILLGALVVVLTAVTILLLVIALVQGRRFPQVVESRLPGFVRDFREQAERVSLSPRSLAAPFLLSLLADLLGVVSMWAALHALRVDAGLVLALAAYTVGTLLQLAAPVFQGLGIVEVSVILLLENLGVPLPAAIGATVVYRLADVWLPVILGVGVHARYQPALRGLPAQLPAVWTALSGLLALASVLPATFHARIPQLHRAGGLAILDPFHAQRTITLVAGFLLLVLGVRLVRRQHSAWVVALVLSCIVTVVYILRDFDGVIAIISGANVALLLLYRRRFRVRSDIPSLWRGGLILLVSFSVTYLFGVVSLWVVDKQHFGRDFSIWSSLRTARDIYLGFGDGGLIPVTSRGEWILDSMHLLGALSILVSVYAILQPIVWRRRVQRVETEHARRLIAEYGDSALDRFKSWPDKHQFFASGDKGVVSYGLSGRVALVLGDPAARDSAAFAETLDEFLDFCDLNGWEPAFHQTTAEHLEEYRKRGFTAMMIGQDAVVRLDTFSLSGKSMASLRTTRNKASRENLRVEAVSPPLPDALVVELGEVSDEWLTLEGRRERTFTLGQFEPQYIRESRVLVLRSAEGRAEAFVNLIPAGAPGDLTLDLMRHRVDAPNGSMDLLILAMIDLARAEGYTTVSLGMVPFAKPQPEDESATDRAIARLAGPMNRFFASESLFAYKNKFHPDWQPRYLVVRSVAQLPRAVLALTRLAEVDRRALSRTVHRRAAPVAGGDDRAC